MPLQKKCSIKAFKKNIDIQRGERGKHKVPTPQELAIAYSTLRKSCGLPYKGQKMTPSKIVASKKAKEENTSSYTTRNALASLMASNEAKSQNRMPKDMSIDEISENLSAPVLGPILAPMGAINCTGRDGQQPQDTDSRQGVLMAIDDIDRQLNYYDQLSHRLKMDGKDQEALEVKDMANSERKNKVRLRDMLKVLEASK